MIPVSYPFKVFNFSTLKKKTCLAFEPDLDNLDDATKGEGQGEEDEDDRDDDQNMSTNTLALFTG